MSGESGMVAMQMFAASLAAGIATLFALVAGRYIWAVARWVPREERWQRGIQGQCPECGYDLRDNLSGVCPECGTRVRQPTVSDHGPQSPNLISEKQPWWVWLIVVVAMIITILLARAR